MRWLEGRGDERVGEEGIGDEDPGKGEFMGILMRWSRRVSEATSFFPFGTLGRGRKGGVYNVTMSMN